MTKRVLTPAALDRRLAKLEELDTIPWLKSETAAIKKDIAAEFAKQRRFIRVSAVVIVVIATALSVVIS